MRTGYVISGTLHGAAILAVLIGTDWFRDTDDTPFNVTEVALVDGNLFDAQLSSAPIVPNEGPADLSEPSEGQSIPDVQTEPDEQIDARQADAQLSDAPRPPSKPSPPEISTPAPPTSIPTEAPRPSIAELPSPDVLPDQASEPESPPATEPLQPLASAPSPAPAPRPLPPPEPEPEVAEELEEVPEEQEDRPVEVAEEQPDAPESAAPQESRLPVAKPSDKAKAAIAARETKPQPDTDAEDTTETETAKTTPEPQPAKPSKPAGGSKSVFAQRVSRGEKDALQIGIKRHFIYTGSPERGLVVKIEIRMGRDGTIRGKPKLLSAEGGNKTSQRALFSAGTRALIKAQNAGEFRKLPPAKYEAWKLIHVRFTPTAIGFAS